ncbi:hypothetical protein HOLleu_30395 [Holothuria leucospilota]|uniref:CxC5 like cysteine cluster associated with KDZ domain-containing protein n=1 Tax=Holothuria leucospilota TaxID=206669 RepID=A0A9Q1H137_HOLLE|nr:hypothetical protein HOLleu_30395 [Holothuria leucospilota]
MAKRPKFSIQALLEEVKAEEEQENKLKSISGDIKKVTRVKRAMNCIPPELPPTLRAKLLVEFFDVTVEDTNTIEAVGKLDCFCGDSHVFAPPVGHCIECDRELVLKTRCKVRYVSLEGVKEKLKLSLKCSHCELTYTYSKFGRPKDGMRFYDEEREGVEVTDGVIFSKRLCELQSCLGNHAWVSFEGFAESFNEALVDQNSAIDRRTFSKAWYWFEVEKELRRIGRENFFFSGSGTYFEDAFSIIEETRQKSLYKHTCSDGCLKKGCSKMIVVDGIWKLNFTHCMMVSKNVSCGVPVLNLPDVCTNEPQHGHAFCSVHVSMVNDYNKTSGAPSVPTKLKEFLKYCNVGTDGDNDKPSEDESSIMGKVVQTAAKCGLDTTAGSNVINQHSGQEFITPNMPLIKDVLAECDERDRHEVCNKDTGDKKPLNQRSRGHMVAVSPGGHILMFNPLYRSESPSQALLFMLSVVCLCLGGAPETLWGGMWIAYDNMCNILKLKAMDWLKKSDGLVARMFTKCQKIIDGLHISNHKSKFCQEVLHPSNFDNMYPELKGTRNTMVAEQTFVWLGRFKKIVCAMPKSRHMFFLHRMIIRRNSYTSNCHARNINIVLPKVRNQYTT